MNIEEKLKPKGKKEYFVGFKRKDSNISKFLLALLILKKLVNPVNRYIS